MCTGFLPEPIKEITPPIHTEETRMKKNTAMIYLPRGKQSSLKLRGDLALASLLLVDEGSR